ncbi:hypothetical protein ABEP13_08850, partial [Geobacillus stearothermophilus]|uniref:hypothetical protein n=1 Tax=Geobacillus stearothermophilus TaxID=1422 RepID=UPI003D260A33
GGPASGLSPPQQDRSVASRWRPELDIEKRRRAVRPGFFRRLSSFEGMTFLLDNIYFLSIINDVETESLA